MKEVSKNLFALATLTAVIGLHTTNTLANNNALSALKQAFEQEKKVVDYGNKFFKVSNKGKVLSDDAKQWGCVQDKSTGLY